MIIFQEPVMPKKVFKGRVIKNQNDKTIIVDVETIYMHKKYKKYLRKNKKYAVHDESSRYSSDSRV